MCYNHLNKKFSKTKTCKVTNLDLIRLLYIRLFHDLQTYLPI